MIVCGLCCSCPEKSPGDWMSLVARFSQPENAHLLRTLNDGLASVMKGLQTVSDSDCCFGPEGRKV